MSDPDASVPLDALLAHRAWVRTLARQVVSDVNAADDVEQETWLQAIERPPRHAGSLRGWLGTVVRNVARKSGRTASRRARREELNARGPSRSAAELVADAEVHKRLVEALLALEEPYRATVLFRFYDGLPPREVAARMGVPVETVRTRLRRALVELREHMDGRERRDRAAWIALLGGPGGASVGRSILRTEVVMGATRKAAVAAAILLLAVGSAWVTTRGMREVGESRGPAATNSPGEDPASEQARTTSDRKHGTRAVAASAATDSAAKQELVDARDAIAVLVRSSAGEPVAGATVELHERNASSDAWLADLTSRLGAPTQSVASVRTDASGRARLPAGNAATLRTVVARRVGFATGSAFVGPSRNVELVLVPGHSVTGRITDHRGRPIPGAVVMAGPRRIGNGSLAILGSSELARTVADEQGHYALDGLPRGVDVFFAGWPHGVPAMAVEADVPSATTVDLVVEGGGAIEGKVTDEATGTPIADAIVTAVKNMNSWAFGFARTDANGVYRVNGFPYSFLNEVHAQKPGWYEVPRRMQYGHHVVPEEGAAQWDLAMRRGAKLRGRVLGPAGPVPGARVTAAHNDPDRPYSPITKTTTADAEGRFAFDSLVPGPTVLAVAADGVYQDGFPRRWIDAVRDGTAPTDANVDIAAEGETVHDVHLVAGLSVSGHLLRADGQPAAGASIQLYSDAGYSRDEGPFPSRDATTDSAGAFTLRGVPIAGKAQIWASASDQSSARTDVVLDPARGASDVVVRLAPPVTLRGRVVFPDGARPDDVVVLVGVFQDPRWIETAFDNASGSPVAVAADGSFEKALGAQDGTYVVRAVATGYPVADSDPIHVTPDQREIHLTIQVAAGCRLAGDVVVRGSGVAVPRARLHLVRLDPHTPPPPTVHGGWQPPPLVSTTADTNGAFRIESALRGSYDLSVDADGMSSTTTRVELPREERLRIELAPKGDIRGRVHFADGKPAAGVPVFVPMKPAGHLRVVTDSDGAFRFEGVADGTYEVWVSSTDAAPGANVQRADVQGVRPGGDPVDLTVQPALSIAGTLLDEAGKPFDQAIVSASPDDPPNSAQAGQGAAAGGRFEIRGLAPGMYVVRTGWLSRDGATYLVPDLPHVTAGATDVALVARPGLSIEGAIAAEDLVKASIDAIEARPMVWRPGGGLVPRARVASQGRFRIDGLLPGRYRLVVKSANGTSLLQPRGEDAVVEAGAHDLRLKLDGTTTISGTVVFTDRPLVYVHVGATPVGGGAGAAGGDEYNGNFTVFGLEPGRRYDVTAWYEGLLPARVANVLAGSTDVKLVLERGLTVRGRLLRPDGTPAAKRTVVLHQLTGDTRCSAATADDGTFEVTALVPGEYRAEVYVKVPGADGKPTDELRPLGTVRAGDAAVELRLPE